MSRRPDTLAAFISLSLAVLLQASWMLSYSSPKSHVERPRGAPQRVVIFPPVLWAYATLDQSVDHVVGIASFLARDARDGLLDVIYPRLDSVPVVATRGALTAIPASPEELLALHPDMVVTWKSFADPLRAAGLPVLELTINRKSERASMLQQWHMLAAAIDRGSREALLEARYQHELSSIAREDGEARPTALVLLRSTAGTFLTDARENLAVAGARRPSGVPLVGRLSDEELLRIDPDFVFLQCCAGPGDTPAAFYSDDRFASLKAVRRRQVYLEPSGSFHMEGLIQEPILDEWMAELLNPSRPSLLPKNIAAVFKEEYSSDIDASAIQKIVHLRENRESKNYDRFAGGP